MNQKGFNIKNIFITGGSAKNTIYVEEHASVTNCSVMIPQESESVLVGAALLGAVAAKRYETIREAMSYMNGVKAVVSPNEGTRKFHQLKYQVFLKMYEDFMSYRIIMENL
jgi:ribulose kinase